MDFSIHEMLKDANGPARDIAEHLHVFAIM